MSMKGAQEPLPTVMNHRIRHRVPMVYISEIDWNYTFLLYDIHLYMPL